MNRAALFKGGLIALTAALPATAQTPAEADTTKATRVADGAAIGFSVAKVIVPGEHFSLTLIGFHVTQLRSGSVGAEFAVYTSPFALSQGAIALAPQ